jgi:hypothetical protein
MKIKFWSDKNNNSYSAYPPTTYLTFAYWIYMVPQYKPKNVLILGYAGGTVAGLIRLLYGDVPITAVDIEPCENKYDVTLIQADAREYVKTCPEFDCVIVDIFYTDYAEPCEFVVKDLTRISNYLIVNSLHTDMSAYKGLKKVGQNKASGCAEVIYYFLVKGEIPNLHPYG